MKARFRWNDARVAGDRIQRSTGEESRRENESRNVAMRRNALLCSRVNTNELFADSASLDRVAMRLKIKIIMRGFSFLCLSFRLP